MGFAVPQTRGTSAKKGKRADADGRNEGSSGSGSQQSSALMHAVAGALAGAISRFVVGPLDVLKIRFQVQLEPIDGSSRPSHYTSLRQALGTIVREEGVKGLWRGTVPGQLLTIPYTAVQFVALQQCKQLAERHGLSTHPQWRHAVSFVSGAAAGAAGTIASYPFDLLRTTLAAQGEPKVYACMSEAARDIVRQHGVKGLYRGLGVTVLEIIPYAALQFGLYDIFLSAYSDARVRLDPSSSSSSAEQQQPSSFQCFVCGLAAGTAAKLGTHPLDVVKKRFQVAGLQRSMRYGKRVPLAATRSLVRCLLDIWEHEGLRGLYKGAAPSVLKAAPAAAVTFMVHSALIEAMTARASSSSKAERNA